MDMDIGYFYEYQKSEMGYHPISNIMMVNIEKKKKKKKKKKIYYRAIINIYSFYPVYCVSTPEGLFGTQLGVQTYHYKCVHYVSIILKH